MEERVIWLTITDRKGVPRCIFDAIEDRLSVSDQFELYHVREPSGHKDYLLRVPVGRNGSSKMSFEADKLSFMAVASERLEKTYQDYRHDPGVHIHYDWLFPELVDTFISGPEQGNRQMNLLTIRDAAISDFVPMSDLQIRYNIDAKTCAWILGRFFKLQAFLEHVGGIFIFRADQVILEPKAHRMVHLDWSYSDEVYHWDSVNRAAFSMSYWLRLNGTPYEENFRDLLAYFNDSIEMRGEEAYKLLYKNIDEWWGRDYHPFTYFDKERQIWHTLDDDSALL